MGIFNIFKKREKSLSTVDSRGGWFSILEPFSGAWQRNIQIDRDCVLKNPIVFTCVSGIASDISKMPVSLERETNKIWIRTDYSREAPVIKKPNLYQNWIQFLEYWIISKTSHGNTYALKERNRDGKVIRLYILDPRRVVPLVAEDGSVYYQLGADNLSKIGTSVTAPASEIIHDRYNCLFHPLVGISPLFASSIVACQSNNIHDNSTVFFGNMSRPSGILTAPGAITNETAERLKNHWQTNYSGNNLGKVAVLGDDLKYQPITVSASDSQLIEQLKYSGEVICACFHYPAYKAGLGTLPSYNNIAALNQEYFSGCLQPYVESIESLLKEGLELIDTLRVNLDENVLIRMDKATQIDMYSKATSSLYKIDEARERLNLPPINGGNDIYMQQQNYSLTALHTRDQQTPLASVSDTPNTTEVLETDPDLNKAYIKQRSLDRIENVIQKRS